MKAEPVCGRACACARAVSCRLNIDAVANHRAATLESAGNETPVFILTAVLMRRLQLDDSIRVEFDKNFYAEQRLSLMTSSCDFATTS